MSRTAATGSFIVVLLLGADLSAQTDGLMCVEPANRSRAESGVDIAGGEPTDAEVVLFVQRDADQPAFLMDALRADLASDGDGADAGKPGSVRYSLTGNVTAAVSYSHAFLFDTASDEELRKSRVGAFSTARERDVLGLGMDWGVGQNSSVGIGYQLQSVRPDGSTAQPGAASTSILPRSEAVDHTFTLGVTRSWGGSDGE